MLTTSNKHMVDDPAHNGWLNKSKCIAELMESKSKSKHIGSSMHAQPSTDMCNPNICKALPDMQAMVNQKQAWNIWICCASVVPPKS